MVSLKKQEDFKRCYRKGRSYGNRTLVLYVYERQGEENETSRLGISVSKKVGNSVVRHRVTRRIRESYRRNESRFNSGLDMIVVARILTAQADFHEIESALLALMKKAGILQ